MEFVVEVVVDVGDEEDVLLIYDMQELVGQLVSQLMFSL